MQKWHTIPGEFGSRRVDHVLHVEADFPGLPSVYEMPNLYKTKNIIWDFILTLTAMQKYTKATCEPPHLTGPEQVQTDVGVARCGIQRVLTVVLTHVLWSGLWEQTIYALPKSQSYGYNSTGHKVSPI